MSHVGTAPTSASTWTAMQYRLESRRAARRGGGRQSLWAGLPGGERHHDGKDRHGPSAGKLGAADGGGRRSSRGQGGRRFMRTLIRNGVVATCRNPFKANILIEGEQIREISN